MATTQRKKPYIYVTWLTGLLSGKQQCAYPAWFKAKFKSDEYLVDDNFNLDAWAADHNAMVQQHATMLSQDEGRKVTIENENSFYLHGQSAILAGKPDIISRKDGTSLRVSDGKTGEKSPKDFWQVLLYLIAIPMAWKKPDLRIHGEVFYKDGTRIYIEPEEVTEARRQEVVTLIRRVAQKDPVPKTPNVNDCSRCDIPNCEQRMKATDPEILTAEF